MESYSDINWMTCTPDELQQWLLQYRFPNEPSKAVAFLQQTISGLDKTASTSQATPEAVSKDLGNELLQNSDNLEVSLTTPRVKASWNCFESGMRFTDKKGESMIVRKAKYIVVFPKPEDCNKNKNVTDMVLLIPQDGDDNEVTYKTKKQAQICFQLPSTTPEWVDAEEEDMDSLDHTDQWIAVLCRCCDINVAHVVRVLNPAMPDNTSFWRYQFQSHQEESTSTTTGGMPFVKCYHGVNDGALYPLLEGLLFFKPPLFIPRSQMESIGCGRGDSGSRYVDLQVSVSGKQLDFSNISRAELNELRDYIHQKLIPAMKKDLGGGENESSPSKSTVAETDSEKDFDDVKVKRLKDDDDDDEDVEEENEGLSSTNSSRKRRKASLEAEAVNRQSVGSHAGDDDEEEDGDMDYEARGDKVENDDDDESDEDDDFEEQAAETETESEDDDDDEEE